MAFRLFHIGLLPVILLPAAALADEVPADSGMDSETYYSGLEDLSLRQDITGISHYYMLRPEKPSDTGDDVAADSLYQGAPGGSAGGYVNFGSPATSTFLGPIPEEKERSWMDGVEFGVDWRPDISGAQNQDYRRMSRSFSGSEIDRVGVRADLTASLRDDADAGSSAWRVTGMLGSTSLSLLSGENGMSSGTDSSGLLWDIGVGWSNGAMSVNAGYQSGRSLDAASDDSAAIAVLSLGADYAILPGFSIYGEFNVIDGPLDENVQGLGTVVIVGTGVSF